MEELRTNYRSEWIACGGDGGEEGGGGETMEVYNDKANYTGNKQVQSNIGLFGNLVTFLILQRWRCCLLGQVERRLILKLA